MRAKAASWFLAIALCAGASARADDPAPSQKDVLEQAGDLDRRAAGSATNRGIEEIVLGVATMKHGRIGIGTVEVVEGILSLCAAGKARKQAERNKVTLTDLGAAPAGGDPGAAGGPSTGASLAHGGGALPGGNGGISVRSTKVTAEELMAAGGKPLKEGLKLLEDQYGFDRGKLLEALADGTSGHDLLTTAPLNAFTEGELADAIKAAHKEHRDSKGSYAKDAKDAKAAEEMVASPPPAATAPPPEARAAAEGEDARSRAGKSGLRDALARGLVDDDETELSPEVKAALATREAKERAERNPQKPQAEMDLFEVVHLKYRERENHLRWGTPLAPLNGG